MGNLPPIGRPFRSYVGAIYWQDYLEQSAPQQAFAPPGTLPADRMSLLLRRFFRSGSWVGATLCP